MALEEMGALGVDFQPEEERQEVPTTILVKRAPGSMGSVKAAEVAEAELLPRE